MIPVHIISIILTLVAFIIIYWVHRRGQFMGKQIGLKNLFSKIAIDEESKPYQRILCVILHVLVIIFILLALYDDRAMPEKTPLPPHSSILFALDVSNSMNDNEVQRWCKNQIKELHNRWHNKVDMSGLAFSGTEQLIFTTNEQPDFRFDRETIQPEITHIQNVLRLGGSILTTARDKKILLFTDGNESAGNSLVEAYHLKKNNVQIYPIIPPKFKRFDKQEIDTLLLKPLHLPAHAYESEPFEISLLLPDDFLSKLHGKQGMIKIGINGIEKGNYPITFQKTHGLFKKNIKCDFAGLTYIRMTIESGHELPVFYEGFINISEKPKMLILERSPSRFVDLFTKRGFNAQSFSGNRFYLTNEILEAFDIIFLNDIDLDSLDKDSEFNIIDAVKDKGKGLFLNVGAACAEVDLEASPLYEILPMVSAKGDSIDGEGSGKISLCIVIDNSGSMSDRGLDKAAQSLIRSWENMRNIKQLCIFAYDTSPYWLTSQIPTTYNKNEILTRLEQLGAGGGGILINPALKLAYSIMQKAKNERHVLLITDLEDSEDILYSDKEAKVAYYKYGIRTHILAIGDEGFYRNGLKLIAKKGHGSYKEITKSQDEIANIKWKGMSGPARRYQDKKIQIIKSKVKSDLSQVLNGIPEKLQDGKGCAPLESKPGAITPFHVILPKKKGDKTYSGLAHWIAGNGRVAVLNAGIEKEEGWYHWEYRDKFWSQLVRWLQPHYTNRSFFESIECKQGGYRFIFERNIHAPFVLLPEIVQVIESDNLVCIPLKKIDEIHYECTFYPEKSASYLIRLIDNEGEEIQSNSYYLPKAVNSSTQQGEIQDFSVNYQLLKEIAEVTDGEVNPTDIRIEPIKLHAERSEEHAFWQWWPIFLFIAMILFWIEIAIRNDLRKKDIKISYTLIPKLIKNKVKF